MTPHPWRQAAAFWSRLSLRLKLPLQVGAILVLVLLIDLWAAHRSLEETLVAEAGDRIATVSALLTGLVAQGSESRVAELEGLAAELAGSSGVPSSPEARLEILQEFATAHPAIISLELRAGGDCVAGVVRGLPTAGDEDADADPGPRPLETGCSDAFTAPPEGLRISGGVSEISLISGRMFNEVLAPVGEAEDREVYLVDRRISQASGVDLVAGLISRDMEMFVGNRPGMAWTDFIRARDEPPEGRVTGEPVRYRDPSGVEHLGIGRTVEGTPWALWLQRDLPVVLAPSRAFLRSRLITVLVILAVAGFVVWRTSRAVTGPLAGVTDAAEDMARGDYDRRVEVRRGDELGRLGTAFNTMAEQVARARSELEVQVEERTRDLAQALDELERTQDELVRKEKLAYLGQLAGGLGHELRNPLAVMQNALYYMENVLDGSSAKSREYVDILKRQVQVSTRIVSDLLDFAREPDPKTESVDLKALVREQLDRVPDAQGIEVVEEFPPEEVRVLGDPGHVAQVVLNLLTNAVQAMEPDGGTLKLRVRREPESSGGTTCLDVIDTGEGIPSSDVERVFEPLYSTKTTGIGLGLAVSRTLVEANGGSLHAESTPGAGASFTLELLSGGSTPSDASIVQEVP